MKRKILFQALPMAFIGLAAVALSSGCKTKSHRSLIARLPPIIRAAAKRAPNIPLALSSPVRVPRLQPRTRLSSP